MGLSASSIVKRERVKGKEEIKGKTRRKRVLLFKNIKNI